jgi:hypothetical protein
MDCYNRCHRLLTYEAERCRLFKPAMLSGAPWNRKFKFSSVSSCAQVGRRKLWFPTLTF